MAKTWKESRSNITCKCMHSCSKSRIPRVWSSFPKKLTQVTLELYPTQSFTKQIGSFLEAVEEHFAALRHSSLDEETSITTNFFSKRQFLKLNTVGQVRKNAIMHISCHYLNSMKPVHLLTMREEPPGIVHCSLSLTILRRKIQKFWDASFPHCVVIIGWGMLSYHHFLFWKKKSMTRLYVYGQKCIFMAQWTGAIHHRKKEASKPSKNKGEVWFL